MRYWPHYRKEKVPDDDPKKAPNTPDEEWGFIIVKADRKNRRWEAKDHLYGHKDYNGDFIHEDNWKSLRDRKKQPVTLGPPHTKVPVVKKLTQTKANGKGEDVSGGMATEDTESGDGEKASAEKDSRTGAEEDSDEEAGLGADGPGQDDE